MLPHGRDRLFVEVDIADRKRFRNFPNASVVMAKDSALPTEIRFMIQVEVFVDNLPETVFHR